MPSRQQQTDNGNGEVTGRRASGQTSAFVAYILALLATMYAAVLDLATFATNDYTWILIRSMGCAAAAIVLLLVSWRRMPGPGRGIAASLMLVDLWVLWNAGVERLLQW